MFYVRSVDYCILVFVNVFIYVYVCVYIMPAICHVIYGIHHIFSVAIVCVM